MMFVEVDFLGVVGLCLAVVVTDVSTASLPIVYYTNLNN